MRYLLLPLFITRLFIASLPTVFLLTFFQLKQKLNPYRSLILSLIFFVSALLILNFYQSQQSPTPVPSLSRKAAQTQLKKQKSQLEALLNKQPTHRDILYNLAQINQALNNQAVAEKYLQQARQLDPNHQLFIE